MDFSRIRVLFFLLAAAVGNCFAATQAISLSFSGTASGVFGSGPSSIQGTVTVAPFGSASYSFAPGTFPFSFNFGNGNTMSGTATLSGSGSTANGTATITSGTGTLAGATGSFTFTFLCTSDCEGQKGTPFDSPYNGSGSGSVSGPELTGPGGSGYPIAGPGGSGYPVSGPGGSGYPQITCFIGSGGIECTTTAFDGSTGSGSSVLVFDGSGSSGSSVLVFDGAGGSGSSVLTFEGSGGSGSSVLVFDGSGGSGSSVDRICQLCGAISPHASTAGSPIEIMMPVQSSASTYTATPNCPNEPNSCWISIPVSSGTIATSSSVAVTAFVNPQGLAAGTYPASVAIAITSAAGATSTLNVPITTIVTAPVPLLSASQTGLQFQAISGSTAAQGQSISISNPGAGSLAFTATASTLTGGNWLTVSPSSGSAPATVAIQANPTGLAPGEYFGSVALASSGATNSPESVEVALTVLSPSTTTPLILPTSLTFIAPASGNPASQYVQVINPGSQTLTATLTSTFAQGSNWFTATASASSVTSSQPLVETINVTSSGLAAGTYSGTLDIHLAETDSDYLVPIELIVPKTTSSATGTGAACTPTRLLPTFTNLEGGFSVSAGVPVPVQLAISDDCGSPLTSGAVTLYFPGSSDPAVSLSSLGNGQWAGSWMPHHLAGGSAQVGVLASSFASPIYGSSGIAGTVTANPTIPMIDAGGAVSAASLAASAPLAPGAYISIFGSNLAATSTAAGSFPFPTTLGNTQVFLGGEALPLEYAGPGQINAVLPYDAQINSVQQLVVEQNGQFSLPEPVIIAAAQPAVFTQNQSGTGPGAIDVIHNGSLFLNTAATPATAGDDLVIYCSGLGAVTPAIAAGSAAPTTSLTQTVNPVTVTVGGQPAQVLFSGLAPGYSGLYQINVVVPSGVATGSSVPVIVTTSGASSPAVTVAIQ